MKVLSNGITLHVCERGHGGPALLFLHYWGGSSGTWSDVIDRLADTYRCIAFDLRGWGESDAPEHGYAIGDLADDAAGVVEALELDRYVLIGHSMGGKTAQLMASRRPPGLVGVVLIGPSPPAPTLLDINAREQLLHAYDSRESIEFVRDNVLTSLPLSSAQKERVVADSLLGAPQARLAWPTVAMPEDIRDAVASINVPTLVISGAKDQVDPVARLKKDLLPYISGAVLTVIPGAGHLAMLEAPDAVADRLRRFLATLA